MAIIYISSTYSDLKDHREAVYRALRRMRYDVIAMEDYVAADQRPLDKCLEDVAGCDLYVGIFARRYGYVPPDQEKSITELEFRQAVKEGKPCLLFLLDEEVSWPPSLKDAVTGDGECGARINALREELKRDYTVAFFKNPDHLAAKVSTAVSVWASKQGPTRFDFYEHVHLPSKYVPRPELLAEVRRELLATGESGMALTSALHGMGGIGKTVVARALCEDEEIQSHFADGILWTTLGEKVSEGELKVKLRAWVNAVGGAITQDAPSLETLKNALAQRLKDKACLLILDDVWKRTDAEVFRIDEPKCRLLLTTRNAEIPRGLGANVQPIPTMARAEAVALLEEWANGNLDQAAVDQKEEIVRRLGYLPLAIKLAGGQLGYYESVREWLAEFKAIELEAMRVEDVHDSLKQTFNLSLKTLDEKERYLYNTLAIFKEDEPISEKAVMRLWYGLYKLKRPKARMLLGDLAARALLQLDDDQAILHDLLRDFMADELGEEGKIEAHRALLDAYRQTQTDQGWHTAPDDGYLYDHLAYHLDQIASHDPAAAEELERLFADDAWLHVRVPGNDYEYDGYITDLNRAWERAQAAAHRQIEADRPVTALAVASAISYEPPRAEALTALAPQLTGGTC
jgi:hypothetical protein